MTILYYISFLISTNPRVPIFLGIGKPLPLYPHLGIVGSHEASIVNGNGTHLKASGERINETAPLAATTTTKKKSTNNKQQHKHVQLIATPRRISQKNKNTSSANLFFPKSGLRFYVKLHGHVWYIMVIMVLISVTVPLSSHRLFQWLARFF